MQRHKKNLNVYQYKSRKIKVRFFFFKQFKQNRKNRNWVTIKKNIFDRKLTIRLTQNNVFLSLMNLKTKKLILIGSAGKYRILISKKKLKKNIIRILKAFCRQAKKQLTSHGIIINLIAPLKVRKKIIRFLKIIRTFKVKKVKKLYYRAIIFQLESVKCFNGCRAPHKKRKKRKGWRILKY